MQKQENKINIGLDIGTSSVGWSIIDDNYNIIDMGVRLFDDPANPKDGKLENVNRREARHVRRLYSRRKIRKNELEEILINNNLVTDHNDFCDKINIDITEFNCNNPIELKCKALKQKVSKSELVYILFHYINHRGYFYLTDDERKNLKKDVVETNSKPIDDFPSKMLFAFYKENGYYKDAHKVDSKLLFSNTQWQKEIKELLHVQGCSDKFIEDYLDIFKKIRKFNQGPGGPKSPTPYGLYRIDPKDNIVKSKGKNLWDVTIGTCSYYYDGDLNKQIKIDGEPITDDKHGKVFRGFKNGPIAELFNFFNDISNLRLRNEKFPRQVTFKLIDKINKNFPNKNIKFTLKNICKLCNEFYISKGIEGIKSNGECISENDISGYRTKGKDSKFDFTSLSNFQYIAKYLYDNYDKLTGKYKYSDKDNCYINNIDLLKKSNQFFIDIAKNSSDYLTRVNWLNETFKIIDKQQNEDLANKLKGLTQSSSLSDLAMLKYINYFINYKPKNDDDFFDNWTIYSHNNPPYPQFYDKDASSKKIPTYLPSNMMDDEVVSPTVKRSFNQACQIVNKIISIYCRKNKNKPNKKIFKISNITIELPRDKNTKEEKQRIKKYQDENKSRNEEAAKKHVPNEWWALYKWQNKTDLYDGQTIDLNNYSQYQVDHIIPLSISSDDSLANKVLTRINNNHDKGQNTPFQWLTNLGTYGKYKARVIKLWNEKSKKEQILYKKKFENLLYEKEPLENIHDFINRNLVDTRYASRLVLNKFQNFFKTNNDYGPVDIKVVRGSITNLCRYSLFYDKNKKSTLLPKNRALYCHHAIDASLICFLGMNDKIHKLIKWCDYFKREHDLEFSKDTNQLINQWTGEKIDIMKLYNKGDNITLSFGKELARYNDKIVKNKMKISNKIGEANQSEKKQFIPAEKKVHFSRKLISKNNIQLFGQTIYSLHYDQVSKTYQIISKIDLMNSNTKDLEVYFDPNNSKFKENVKKLLIYQKDKKLYDTLQKIFNDYSSIDINDSTHDEQLNKSEKNEKPKNPFIAYMNFEHKQLIANYVLLNNNQRVRRLKYVDREYDSEDKIKGIILKKYHNSHAIMMSLNWLSLRLYKDIKNKPIIVPINSHVLTWNAKLCHLYIDQCKLKNVLKDLQINNEEFIELKRGSILVEKNTNDIYYICGWNGKRIEIKPINYWYEYYQKHINNKENKKQCRISISDLFKNYYLVQNDILGKIYNKINFS